MRADYENNPAMITGHSTSFKSGNRTPVRKSSLADTATVVRQGGFTIVELMITVSVIAIIASIAFPSFEYAIANSRVRTAATDMHMSLLLARSEAIKRNNDVVIERSGGNWKDGWDVKSGSTVIRNWGTQNDVSIDCYKDMTASTSCDSTVTFQRAGRASSPIYYRVFDSENTNIPARCVRVSLSGRAGVSLDNDNDATNGCG
ncbi:MAG: GspH/FimT family pseudopilin [Gammaproteobacteria bacterium]